MSVDYDKFVQLFGTFFSRFYKNLPWYEGLMKATLGLQEQAETNLDELEKSAFRRLIPLYHTEHVHVFDKNDNSRDLSPLRYDDPLAYFAEHKDEKYWLDAIDKFDSKSADSNCYRPGLDNVISIEQIIDHPIHPTLILIQGIDYEIKYGLINFLTEVPDQRLFLINVKTDENWIYKHFGTLIGLKKDKSSESYKAVVNALWDCYNHGGACTDVFGLIAAITGNAVAKEDETVVRVSPTSITTDKNTYPITQPARVQAGDGVKAGDSLTESFDTIEINSFNHSDDIPGITLHRSMLGEGYRGSLTFINDVVPLQIKDGQYKFKLFGYPADEKRFWNNFYQNLRQNKIDPHDIFSFAAIRNQINPFRFLVDNALKYHFTFITVKNVKYPTAITLSDVSLQKLLPPWNGLIIQVNADLTGQFRTAADDNDSVTAKKFITLTGNYQPAFAGKGYLHKI